MYGEPDRNAVTEKSPAAETLIALAELGDGKLNGRTIGNTTCITLGQERPRSEAANIVFTRLVGERTHSPQITIKKGKKGRKTR